MSNDIIPAVPLPRPVAVSVSPQSITGGQSTLYTVTLDPVPTQDQTVYISTDHPEVFVNFPNSLVVSAGQVGTSTTLQTNAVAGTVYASINALCNGIALPCTLTANP
jgi:hypothetical protein